MREKLLGLKSTVNNDIMEDVWWKYNWSAYNLLSEDTIHKLSEALDYFIDTVYKDYELYTEEKLLHDIKMQVQQLCIIYPDLLEDGMGLYDYGGLNDYFVDIVSCFPFYVKEKYRSDIECLYDCINGKPFDECDI